MLILASACQSTRHSTSGQASASYVKPKNVILLIGDGMGLPQITGAMYMNNNKTVFERFRHIGFHKSHSADDLVTDSAAGTTAISCGVKTYNGAIGLNAKKERVPTLLELAEKKGFATGMVTTCSMTHATPGAFIGHVENRNMKEDIALGYLETEIDIFIGGGKDHFDRRKDGRNLITELIHKGYTITDFETQDVNNLNFRTDKNIGYFTSNGEPLPAADGRDYLLPAAKKSIDFLRERTQNGFFLMIEGSQIDWGNHDNDLKYMISELHDFEKVIEYVLDFAQEDGETLVIVTADHETGGFTVQPGSKLNAVKPTFATQKHTALMIPVFAEGPGAEAFRGIYENTEIFFKIKNALSL